MKSYSSVECVLFDFGGCLDSDGVHSRQLFWNSFLECQQGKRTIENREFQDAYSFVDKKINSEALVKNMNLLQMNETFAALIINSLGNPIDDTLTSKMALKITEVQSYYLKRNKSILEYLNNKYLLGIISNFSGNLELILKEFQLRHYFSFVIDSYYIKFQKPDPRIFLGALSKIENTAPECLFIGDNPERDVRPALELGMEAILIDSKISQMHRNNGHLSLPSLKELVHLL